MTKEKAFWDKIIEWAKVPFPFLMFILLIGSGIILFSGEETLERLYLLDFTKEYGQWIGLIFTISAGLSTYYAVAFTIKIACRFYKRKTAGRKSVEKLNESEIAIIMQLYNSPGRCGRLDINNPIVERLRKRHILYLGNQMVSYDVFTNTIPGLFVLQPMIIDEISRRVDRIRKKIEMLDKKMLLCKDEQKKSLYLKQKKELCSDLYYNYMKAERIK